MNNNLMLHRLQDAIRAMPDTLVGEHLTVQECTDYVMDRLSPQESGRVDGHLSSCWACADKTARIATLLHLGTQLRGLTVLPVLDWARVRGALAATLMIKDGQTEDNLLRWHLVEDEEHNLTIYLGSHTMELKDARLRLSAGTWQSNIVLEQVAPDQVGAEILITCQERIDSSTDDGALPLRIELLLDDQDIEGR